MAKLALLLVAVVASATTGCAFKSGPARAASYDYNEYQTYDQPHAQPMSWDAGLAGSAVVAPAAEAE